MIKDRNLSTGNKTGGTLQEGSLCLRGSGREDGKILPLDGQRQSLQKPVSSGDGHHRRCLQRLGFLESAGGPGCQTCRDTGSGRINARNRNAPADRGDSHVGTSWYSVGAGNSYRNSKLSTYCGCGNHRNQTGGSPKERHLPNEKSEGITRRRGSWFCYECAEPSWPPRPRNTLPAPKNTSSKYRFNWRHKAGSQKWGLVFVDRRPPGPLSGQR